MVYTRTASSGSSISFELKRGSGADSSNELFELIQIKATKYQVGILLHRHAETNWPYTMENRSSEWEPRQVNQIASET